MCTNSDKLSNLRHDKKELQCLHMMVVELRCGDLLWSCDILIKNKCINIMNFCSLVLLELGYINVFVELGICTLIALSNIASMLPQTKTHQRCSKLANCSH